MGGQVLEESPELGSGRGMAHGPQDTPHLRATHAPAPAPPRVVEPLELCTLTLRYPLLPFLSLPWIWAGWRAASAFSTSYSCLWAEIQVSEWARKRTM